MTTANEKTPNELFEAIQDKWFESAKQIHEKSSAVAANNKRVHVKPLNGTLDFDDNDKVLWEGINLIDQLYMEMVTEKMMALSCLVTLVNAWHENYDQASMIVASNSFFEQEFSTVLKSAHAETAMINAINSLREVALLSTARKKKGK